MIVEFLKAILYGLVEGITEWLPISSTGHLILFERFLGFRAGEQLGAEFLAEFSEMFQVVVQLGAILAVVVVFFKKLNPFSSEKGSHIKKDTVIMWLKIAVASIPAAFAGIVLDKILEKATGKDIDGWLYNAVVVAIALIVYGILFIVIERANKNKEPKVTEMSQIGFGRAFFIGVFQMLAIIPGTSRSGSTILGSMTLGLSRTLAAEFSFFMAIPAMLGASAIKLLGFFDYLSETSISVPMEVWGVLLIGCAVAFLTSLVAIKFLTDFVKKHSFAPFGVYRIILGALLILYFVIGG